MVYAKLKGGNGMKGFVSMSLVASLVTFAPVQATVYVEYSQAMVELLQGDPRAVAVIRELVSNASITLYSGSSKTRGTVVKTLNGKGFEQLQACFSQQRLNDTCQENDQLERMPGPGVQFDFLRTLSRPNEETSILFTSYAERMPALAHVLQRWKHPFHVLYYSAVGEQENGLFYLSFGPIRNPTLLAGSYLLDQQGNELSCQSRCSGQRVDLYKECFRGEWPGFIQRVNQLFPNRVVGGHYEDCPPQTRPPYVTSSDGWRTLLIPGGEEGFYNRLQACLRHRNGNINAGSGVRLELVFTVLRANPEKFESLPSEVVEMLTNLAGESAASYLQPTEKRMRVVFEECG